MYIMEDKPPRKVLEAAHLWPHLTALAPHPSCPLPPPPALFPPPILTPPALFPFLLSSLPC